MRPIRPQVSGGARPPSPHASSGAVRMAPAHVKPAQTRPSGLELGNQFNFGAGGRRPNALERPSIQEIQDGAATVFGEIPIAGAELSFARDAGKKWGPYRIIDLPEVIVTDFKSTGLTVEIPNNLNPPLTPRVLQQRRAEAFRAIAAVIKLAQDEGRVLQPALYHPSSPWNVILDQQWDLRGISDPERLWLEGDTSNLAKLIANVPYNPLLLAAAQDYQTRRDVSLRKLANGVSTLILSAGDWTNLVQDQLNDKGITPAEKDRLLASRGALLSLSPVSPYVSEIASVLTREQLVLFLAQIPSIKTIREDAEVRAARGLAPNAFDDDYLRWPRSPSDFRLAWGARPLEDSLFKYQWTVFLRNPLGMDAGQKPEEALILENHEMLIAPACSDAGPMPRTTMQWSKIPVQLFFQTRSGMVPGPTVDHYADLSLARWWFSIALALATDLRIITRLDSVNPRTGRFPEQSADGPMNPVGWYAQMYYVRAIAEAIANGYNALNVPWYMDPVARALYRDWFAGHDDDSEFDPRTNHNEGNWFTSKEQCGEKRYSVLRARVQPGAWTNMKVGELPARLDRLLDASHAADDGLRNRKIEFLQKAGVMLWSSAADKDPYIATSTVNRGFASGFAMGWDVIFASPLGLSRAPTDAELALYKRGTDWDLSEAKPSLEWQRFAPTVDRPDIFNDDWYAKIIHASPLQDRNNISDWRTGGFDPGGILGVDVQGSVPLRWYLAWFREWALSLTTEDPPSMLLASELPTVDPGRSWIGFGPGRVIPRRTAGAVLRDVKTYAMSVNLAWGQVLGGQGRFAAALAQKAEEFGHSQPNATIRMVGGVISAIGGGIVSAVGGKAIGEAAGTFAGAGVTMLTELLASAIPSYDCSGYGRDDLGRAKPNFERSYLSGDPNRDTPPSNTVPVPFGFCRGTDTMPALIPMPAPAAPPGGTNDGTKDKGLGTVGKVAIAAMSIGAVGLAATAGYKWYANRPKGV